MSVISTLYCSWWDLYMDWGFPVGARALGVSQYLGETAVADPLDGRLFPRRSFQVGALANTVARAGWAVYISPDQRILQQHVVLLLGCVELLRRAQWATFRLEWEQIHRHLHDEPTEEESIWPSPRGAERPVTLEQALSRNRDMMQTRYTLMEPNEPEESER